jgi:antibiotic biosynthesis monooxygenase (ABM) superfamily enzyme
VFARQKLKRGKEHLFESWLKDMAALQREKFPGYMGSEVIRPACCETNEYVSIFRYDQYENLQRWMDSEERAQMLERTCVFGEEPIVTTYHSLEYWFVGSKGEPSTSLAKKPPSREKMALVTFLVIWANVHFLVPLVGKIPKLPPLALEALSTAIIVILTTYLWMPIVTKYILYWWLFPDPKRRYYCFPGNETDNEPSTTKHTTQVSEDTIIDS